MSRLADLFPQVTSDLKLVRGDVARLALPLRGSRLGRSVARIVAPYLRGKIDTPRQLAGLDGEEARELFPVPRQRNWLRREWGFADELVIGYCGNFGRDHDFSTILDAADLLRDHGDIRFLFVGDGQRRGSIEIEIARRRLHNVMVQPAQARRAESLSAADVHLLSLMPALESEAFPGALYPILAVGRPALFIGDVTGKVATAIGRADCGLSVDAGDGQRLAQVVAALGARPGDVARMGVNARALFVSKYLRNYGWAALQGNLGMH